MREGTLEAINLVYTGHYEAPRDAWETAGFVLGVPLAMGAMAEVGLERLGAEASGPNLEVCVSTTFQHSLKLNN